MMKKINDRVPHIILFHEIGMFWYILYMHDKFTPITYVYNHTCINKESQNIYDIVMQLRFSFNLLCYINFLHCKHTREKYRLV